MVKKKVKLYPITSCHECPYIRHELPSFLKDDEREDAIHISWCNKTHKYFKNTNNKIVYGEYGYGDNYYSRPTFPKWCPLKDG